MENDNFDSSGELTEFMRSFNEYDECDDDSIIVSENHLKPKIINPATEMLNNVLRPCKI